MKKIYTITLLFFSFVLNAQLNEVKELQQIEKKYDSILVEYQKKAKDSLSSFKKRERNEIMAKKESEIVEKMKKEEYTQLNKIKQKESDLAKLNIPDKIVSCNGTAFQMPNLLEKNTKYKPTPSKSTKENQQSEDESLTSIVTFAVTGEGYVKEVIAEGSDKEFNKQLEITLYKIGKMNPRCFGGVAETTRFRMPVKMNFNN
jgi:hypothetical protein